MTKVGLTLVATAALVAVTACGPPAVKPLQLIRMANTDANVAACVADGGVPTRDPQPSRPESDPGPTFICRIVP